MSQESEEATDGTTPAESNQSRQELEEGEIQQEYHEDSADDASSTEKEGDDDDNGEEVEGSEDENEEASDSEPNNDAGLTERILSWEDGSKLRHYITNEGKKRE